MSMLESKLNDEFKEHFQEIEQVIKEYNDGLYLIEDVLLIMNQKVQKYLAYRISILSNQ